MFFTRVYRDDDVMVLRPDGNGSRPASALLLQRYAMNFHGATVGCAYICGAATRRNERGKGLMTRLPHRCAKPANAAICSSPSFPPKATYIIITPPGDSRQCSTPATAATHRVTLSQGPANSPLSTILMPSASMRPSAGAQHRRAHPPLSARFPQHPRRHAPRRRPLRHNSRRLGKDLRNRVCRRTRRTGRHNRHSRRQRRCRTGRSAPAPRFAARPPGKIPGPAR